MKFILPKLFEFMLIAYFVSDIGCQVQIVQYSDSREINIWNPNNASSPATLPLINSKSVKTNSVANTNRKRKRRKKKKKTNVEHVTSDIPEVTTKINNVLDPTSNITVISSRKLKRKKTKTRRRNRKIKEKNNLPLVAATTNAHLVNLENKNINKTLSLALVSRSLVLPIPPTYTAPIKNDTSNVKVMKKKINNTICGKNNGGCAHLCFPNQKRKCDCLKGFRLADDKRNCIDINECSNNNHGCQMNCTNTIGSYRCHCPPGLRLSLDAKSCEDINECLLRNGHGPCQDTCKNVYGGYKCNCNNLIGTKLGNDLHSCVDVNECSIGNGDCSHICINTFGRSFCSCPEGLELSMDFKTCQDINECENEDIKNSCPNGCINTEGSYRCADIFELQNDESYTEITCKPLFPPTHGYFRCSRKHTIETFTKSGRRRVRNSLGTKCILVCPEGYKRIGRRFRITCGVGGHWFGNLDSKCVPIQQDFLTSFEDKQQDQAV